MCIYAHGHAHGRNQKKANLLYGRDARYGVIDNDWYYLDFTGYVFE